ncbi:glutamate ABC transporter substrate-binding protein [Nocardia brasiliensis]|uniref:glutamate ABC transporter substrate-binding protein n=1 Tax=Nocardia brasiliensis TaxID=37326 RepID=UPI00080F4D7C|nr:glutamate ABC transporter substrate-binding protein [Nocardia brasiliensis]OCF85543.1 glutamate-binding protein [Nocardia brasiliensis]
MKINHTLRLGIGSVALFLAVGTTGGCGGNPRVSALEHAATGKLTIGIKFDQPGLGLRNKDGSFTGFDVEVAEYVANKLGVRPDGIDFKETPTPQRELMLESGQVDFVVASYSITEQRKTRIGFAGPYYTAGQALLVRADNTDISGPDDLAGRKVCSAKGSTSAQHIATKFPGAQLHTYDTYSPCLEGLRTRTWDVVTTDDIILAGYAAQSAGAFKVVGKPFSVEKYGIGVQKGDRKLVAALNEAIEKMILDGSWKKAFDATVGMSGYEAPPPPTVEWF